MVSNKPSAFRSAPVSGSLLIGIVVNQNFSNSFSIKTTNLASLAVGGWSAVGITIYELLKSRSKDEPYRPLFSGGSWLSKYQVPSELIIESVPSELIQ